MLSKSRRYYWDQDAVAEPAVSDRDSGNGYDLPERISVGGRGQSKGWTRSDNPTRNLRDVWTIASKPYPGAHFAVMPPALVEPCVKAGSAMGDTVLDPFAGAGTVGVVARKLRREFVGVEINPEFADLARRRIEDDMPMFNRATS